MELTGGVRVRPQGTLLASRAAELLAAGPAAPEAIVAYACNLASPPPAVAARMAAAIFAGRSEFVREADGKWRLMTDPRGGVIGATGSPAAGEHDRLAALTFAVVDVETTGTQPFYGDRITEIAVVVVRDGNVAECFESLVNPQRPIPAFITRLTNITWEMVKDAPVFGDLVPTIVDAISGRVFTAHNATFDWKFLSAELSRASGQTLAGRRLCTVRLARRLLPQLPRRSLDSVARHYGVAIEGRHRAAGDALATARCLLRLLADAADRGCETWEDLQAMGRTPPRKRRRRAVASPTPVSRDTTA